MPAVSRFRDFVQGFRFRRCSLPTPDIVHARMRPDATTTGPPTYRSSVVEHSLGKGEVDSSILSGSTIPLGAKAQAGQRFSDVARRAHAVDIVGACPPMPTKNHELPRNLVGKPVGNVLRLFSGPAALREGASHALCSKERRRGSVGEMGGIDIDEMRNSGIRAVGRPSMMGSPAFGTWWASRPCRRGSTCSACAGRRSAKTSLVRSSLPAKPSVFCEASSMAGSSKAATAEIFRTSGPSDASVRLAVK